MKQTYSFVGMGSVVALMAFLFISPPASAQAPDAASVNLFTNGTFAKGTEGWVLSAHAKKGQMAVDATELHNGKPSLRIDNAEGDDTFVKQKVTVKPNTRYRIAGYIKTKAVQTLKRDGKDGASLSVSGGFTKTPPVVKTKGWTRVAVDFVSGREPEIELGPRLGHYSALTLGTAWYSELTLTELGLNARR